MRKLSSCRWLHSASHDFGDFCFGCSRMAPFEKTANPSTLGLPSSCSEISHQSASESCCQQEGWEGRPLPGECSYANTSIRRPGSHHKGGGIHAFLIPRLMHSTSAPVVQVATRDPAVAAVSYVTVERVAQLFRHGKGLHSTAVSIWLSGP